MEFALALDISGLSPDWLTAIGTFTAAFVALLVAFLPAIIRWRNKAVLAVEFAQNKPFCRHAPLVLGVEHVMSGEIQVIENAYFIRLRIKNRGRWVAKKVEGRLERVIDEGTGGEETDFDPVVLHWVGRDERGPIDINRSEYEYLDVFYMLQSKTATFLVNAEAGQPRGISLERQRRPTRLVIAIYGDEVTPITEQFDHHFRDRVG